MARKLVAAAAALAALLLVLVLMAAQVPGATADMDDDIVEYVDHPHFQSGTNVTTQC